MQGVICKLLQHYQVARVMVSILRLKISSLLSLSTSHFVSSSFLGFETASPRLLPIGRAMAAEEEKPPRRFVVGYALASKKQYSFIQPSLLSVAGSRGIDLVPIDESIPLVDQGPFDCVIHKLCGKEWAAQVEAFSSLHPEIPVIDRPADIERLHNRISMLQVVSDIKISEENRSDTFGIPSQVVIYDAAALADPGGVGCDALQFPVIAKPLVADGSAKSHKMALVFHRDGLQKLKPPLVLQEFVNHGGVIFKVYVVEDYVRCVKRRSLPDVSEENLESTTLRSLSFSQVSNVPSQDLAVAAEEVCLDEVEMPPLGLITDIAHGLRRALGLNLFNFDVIRDVRVGNRYLVIDINYFPGYAKMPSYEDVLTDFFWKILNKENVA